MPTEKLGVTLACNGPASHPGGVAMLLVTLCWVSCDGLASHPGAGVVMLRVASCYGNWS